ncbi:MAG: hypothetical protein ACYTGX_12625 [Planctomycetota bacterium]|jgi:septal ring factor EnvC (AmiA/AmiB activator)
MPITTTNKRALLRALLNTKAAAIDLEFELIMAELDDAAQDVGRRIDRLTRQTKELRGALWEEWTGRAAALEAHLKKAASDVRRTVRDIRKSIKTAERVVKALGVLDDAIAAVATLIA